MPPNIQICHLFWMWIGVRIISWDLKKIRSWVGYQSILYTRNPSYNQIIKNQSNPNCLYFRCTVVHWEECVSAKMAYLLRWCHESKWAHNISLWSKADPTQHSDSSAVLTRDLNLILWFSLKGKYPIWLFCKLTFQVPVDHGWVGVHQDPRVLTSRHLKRLGKFLQNVSILGSQQTYANRL